MTQITIEVSEELAQKLAPMRERLPEVLARGLGEPSPPLNEVYRYILAFLAGNPSPAAILNFRPTPQVQERIGELLEKNRSGELTPAEFTELDEYERLNSFVRKFKIQAMKDLQATS